jgi:sugar phosphate isomerase/epimerase
MQRREFLKASAATAGAAALGTCAVSWSKLARAAARQPIGLQLFTVMASLEQDFEDTLQSVAQIGYKEVETIGAFGRDPHKVRAVLDKYGLVSPSQHLVPGNLYDVFNQFVQHKISGPQIQKLWQETMAIERIQDIIEEGIARAKILGQQYVCLQIIWPEQMASRALMDRFCKGLNIAGELCARAGMVFNFHNHSVEFEPVNGYVPYDLILKNTDPKTVKLEMDMYWVAHAGQDPLKYLADNRGRYKQCHLKDSSPSGDFATVGQGTLNFPVLLAAARKAGVEHYYVEFDRSTDPMKVTRDSYDYLKTVM